MTSIFDIPANEYIKAAAEELKKDITMPEWARFVKTGAGKERPPQNADWYFCRAASILRKLNKLGPIGTNKLRREYGTKKNRGMKPEKFYKGAGKIIRNLLQQLESKGYIKKEEKGSHKGRILTPKGKSFLSLIAKKVRAKPQPLQSNKQ